MSIKDEDLIFYDIEVFKHDSLVVFRDINNQPIGNDKGHWWNDAAREAEGESVAGFETLRQFIADHPDKILIGYNNYHYDDIILGAMIGEIDMSQEDPIRRMNEGLHSMLTQRQIKRINDLIIQNGDLPEDCIERGKQLHTLDCMQQIDVSMPSLKKIEGNMGISIEESDIPFDREEPLSDEEKILTEKYCEHDVEATIEVYKLRKESYFKVKEELLDMLPEDMRKKAYRWNTTTISANVLVEDPRGWREKHGHWAYTKFNDKLGCYKNKVPEDVWKMWERCIKDKDFEGEKIQIDEYGCTIVFGKGGLHGVPKPQDGHVKKRWNNVILLDVGSMYPSIIKNLRVLEEATDKYDQLRLERLKIKNIDKTKSNALKLVLNSVYGNLNNQYSILYNPIGSMIVCMYGMISLYDLTGRLHKAGYTPMNLNTDGVGFVDENIIGKEKYMDIKREWEKDYGLNLEPDYFDIWIQKDVNNYVAKRGKHIKVKGGDVNQYHEPKLFSNSNGRIIHKVLTELILSNNYEEHNIDDILLEINKNMDPRDYQYILRAGSTFKGVCRTITDENGNKRTCEIDPKTNKKYQKVNRVFAVSENYKDDTIYKLRSDGKNVCFPDAPENMKLWNGNVRDSKELPKIIDVKHYVKIILKKAKEWK